MADAILNVIGWINNLIMGVAEDGSNLTGTMRAFMPTLYGFTSSIMTTVVMPVAYTILALFFVLELYKASVRTEGMGGGSANLGAEMVFRVMFRMVICKVAVDSVPIILNAIYDVTTYVTRGVAGVLSGAGASGGTIDTDALEVAVRSLDFWSGLVCLILCFIIYLITLVAVAVATVIIVTRFIELYVHFAIAPIPIATFPSDEMSQIGKSFLKSFAAVCLQGTLIFIVLSFFPILFAEAFLEDKDPGSIFLTLLGIMGYSIALILAVFSAGKWAKAICNAM